MNQIIKTIFNSDDYPKNVNIALLILRVVIGILMLTHGVGKLQILFGSDPIQFSDPLGVGATASLLLVVFAEVFCSIFLIIGLGSRLAAIVLFINMMVIALVVHIDDSFGKQEFALLYAVVYFTLAIIGAGKYSLDYLISKKQK